MTWEPENSLPPVSDAVPGEPSPRIPLAGTDATMLELPTADAIAEHGDLSGIYRLLLHSPSVAAAWLGYLSALRAGSSLDQRLRELVTVRVAHLNRAPAEAQRHVRLARSVGASPAQLQALEETPTNSLFTEEELAALRYVDAMTVSVQVSDETFAALSRHFDRRQVIELTVTTGTCNMLTRFSEALRQRP